jgi:hypothetical protein
VDTLENRSEPIPSLLLYLIGEAAFAFRAYYAETDIPYRKGRGLCWALAGVRIAV